MEASGGRSVPVSVLRGEEDAPAPRSAETQFPALLPLSRTQGHLELDFDSAIAVLMPFTTTVVVISLSLFSVHLGSNTCYTSYVNACVYLHITMQMSMCVRVCCSYTLFFVE